MDHHHCEERQRRSNPVLSRDIWIASRSPSSGADSRDPLAMTLEATTRYQESD
jgi:hypothetical protein